MITCLWRTKGNRFGITFSGKAFTEEVLFRAAYVFELISDVQGKVYPFKLPVTEISDILSKSRDYKDLRL